MGLKQAVLVLALALGSVFGGGVGCSYLRSACDAVAPQILPVQAKLADVQRALAEVERSNIREALSAPQQAVFDEAMKQAWAGYEIAVQGVAVAAGACSKPDIGHAIDMIVKAWSVIHSFLGLFGGAGTEPVTDPMLWVEAQ